MKRSCAAYQLSFWHRFAFYGMGKRCPKKKLMRMLLWIASVVACLVVARTAWSLHPTEKQIEAAYREILNAEAEVHGREYIAERLKPGSQELKIYCSK